MPEKLQFIIAPEAFDHLRSFKIRGRIKVLKTAPIQNVREVSTCLTKAMKVVCQVDDELLREELVKAGVPEERIKSICGNLKIEAEIDVHDCGPPSYMREDGITLARG